jgi:uncharacterized protein YqfA (UPF0365 family)
MAFLLMLLPSAAVVAVMMTAVWVGAPWIQARSAGAPIPLGLLLRAWLRRLPIIELATAYMVSVKSGAAPTFQEYVDLSAAGGNPIRVAAMLAAMRIAEFPHEPKDVFCLELRGGLEAYFREWRRCASRGMLPPDLPRS